MHYSPLATGTGLFILWHAIPRDSPTGLIARLLIDGAGLIFLMILAWAILANLYGVVRWGLPRPRRAVGRHGSVGAGLQRTR